MSVMTPQAAETTNEQYRHAIDDLIALIDELERASFAPRKHRHLKTIHGLVFYTVDTARAALTLLDGGMTNAAAPLIRVCLEHATVVQWIVATPDGVDQFLHQKSFEAESFRKVASKAGIDLPEDLRDHYSHLSGLKAIPSLQQVSNTFKALDDSGHLYMQYRHLSGFIHPSSGTVLRYLHGNDDTPGLRATARQFPQRPLLFTLAMSVMLAVSPYMDLMRTKPYKKRVTAISDAAGLPMWLTTDGKPPKTRI